MTESKAVAVRGQSFGIAPVTFEEAWRFASMIAKSGLAPKGDTPETIMVKMQMGAEVGLAPMQALQNIAVINGRPSVWGDAMPAICMQHRAWESIEETFDDASMTAKCVVKRKGNPPTSATFSKADAEKAQLWGKAIWLQYPKRMLAMRARSWALRDAFPDALRGLSQAEETQDMEPRVKIINPPPEEESDPFEVGSTAQAPIQESDQPPQGSGVTEAPTPEQTVPEQKHNSLSAAERAALLYKVPAGDPYADAKREDFATEQELVAVRAAVSDDVRAELVKLIGISDEGELLSSMVKEILANVAEIKKARSKKRGT